jgi:hypothetical protein
MEQVEVFRTSVATPAQAAPLIAQLQALLPGCRITFDLDDCDKVLRIAGPVVGTPVAIACLVRVGYACVPLD